jgi:N-acetylneuraminate synthase
MHQIRNLNVVWSHSIRNRVVTDVSFAAGFSDHSGTIYPRLAAVTLGIHVLEMHVTFSREIFGLDISASITTSELRQLVEGIRFIEKMIANPVDKETVAKEFGKLRSTFSNSIVARKTLANGKASKADDLTLKKPGTCIPVVGGNCSPIEQAGRSRHLDFRG